jgi:hypothetical protein
MTTGFECIVGVEGFATGVASESHMVSTFSSAGWIRVLFTVGEAAALADRVPIFSEGLHGDDGCA